MAEQKYVVEANGIKREIIGPLAICASREDLLHLRDMIDNWLNKRNRDKKPLYTFGWVQIPVINYTVQSINTPPKPWDE